LGDRRPFLTDVQTLRKRARQHLEQGAVTEGYRAQRETVVRMLNEALATELVCVLRYRRHHFMASGIHAQAAAQEFLQHANEEQAHADQIAARIVQLGGEPDFSPDGLSSRSHAEYVEGASLLEMIQEDLVAERVAIDSYREMIAFLANDDPTTRRMLEGILAMEEEHADDLVSLLEESSEREAPAPREGPKAVPTDPLERVLAEAIDDEYRARATYRAVLEAFGDERPFANIVESEERHIAALEGLYRKRGWSAPADRWAGRVAAPASLREACRAGVEAERQNAALYARLIESARGHADVVAVLRRLLTASQERHLPAFERALARREPRAGAGLRRGRGRRERARGRRA
jgi:bacterioferritin